MTYLLWCCYVSETFTDNCSSSILTTLEARCGTSSVWVRKLSSEKLKLVWSHIANQWQLDFQSPCFFYMLHLNKTILWSKFHLGLAFGSLTWLLSMVMWPLCVPNMIPLRNFFFSLDRYFIDFYQSDLLYLLERVLTMTKPFLTAQTNRLSSVMVKHVGSVVNYFGWTLSLFSFNSLNVMKYWPSRRYREYK